MSRKKTFKVILSEDKEDFEKQVSEALSDGWELGSFQIWSLSSSSTAWVYFQTLIR